ncbi:hypothetical protein ES319_D11G293700v1 [Gossypium barbadense]|uniref:CN hydrolase domain-containing protein n=1 Tax=Gossypium barbadense TaxID=3634 RepID=A0A5J5PKI7_GOSBA|nr:hypothetical protein ES319_D11G293700v1 [Gossypium barbadense]
MKVKRERKIEKTDGIGKENRSTEEKQSFKDGSICGYNSFHRILSANLKPQLFQEVSRLFLGLNYGTTLETIVPPESAKTLYSKHEFDLQAFKFSVDKELLREPRVRVGLIQNSITLPTTTPFSDQKKAIFEKFGPIIDAAGASGVNILCLQEAWMMSFAFCTREKRWCEFAKPASTVRTIFLELGTSMRARIKSIDLNWGL